MAVHQQRHERHLPAMLGDALLPAARQPAVPQLELEPLGKGEKTEDTIDLIHHVPPQSLQFREAPSEVQN
jgi:hypothetical protein